MRDVQGDLVLRPHTRSTLVVLAALAVGGAGIVAAILAVGAPAVFAWVVGALFAVLVVLGAANQFRSALVLTPQEIVVHGLLSRRRRPRSHAVKAVRASIHAPQGATGDTVFVLDAHGDVLIRASAAAYTADGLDRLVDALGVPCDALPRPVTAKQLAKDYPHLVSRFERHPVLIAFAILVPLGAIALALTLLSVA